jgi:hypothetical protein
LQQGRKRFLQPCTKEIGSASQTEGYGTSEREREGERERDDEGGGVPETTREDAAATYAKCNKEATLSAATSGPRWVYKGGPQDLLSLPPSLPPSLNAVAACLRKKKG